MELWDWSQAVRAVAAQRAPWVVGVQSGRQQASGFLWACSQVITVEHVLGTGQDLWVDLWDGSRLQAQVLGADSGLDVAWLQLEGEAADWSEAPSRSALDLEPGEFVLALARSGQQGLALSAGYLACRSGRWTTCRGGRAEEFLQPDLQLYPGYSGGPLFDARGQWLGINTRGLSRTQALTLSCQVVGRALAGFRGGQCERSYLGVGLHSVDLPQAWSERWRRTCSPLVISVAGASPAARAGVLLGDILLSLGGVGLTGTCELLHQLQRLRPGQRVSSTWIRGGQEVELEIELGQRPPDSRHE